MPVRPCGSTQPQRPGQHPGMAPGLPVMVQMGLELQQELQQGRCRQGAEAAAVDGLGHLELAFVGDGRLAREEDIQKKVRRDGSVLSHGPQPLWDDAGQRVPLLNQAWPVLQLGVHPGSEEGSYTKA